jgi:hypothetical protein
MQTFQLKRHLPSCRLDPEGLVKVENYVFEQAEDVFGLSEATARSKCSVVVEERFGKATLSSATELRADEFPDSTISVRWTINAYDPRVKLDVHFHRDTDYAEVEVESQGAQSREKAIGFVEGVYRQLESRRTYNWFFHPRPLLLRATLVVVTWPLFGIVPLAFTVKLPRGLSFAVVVTALGLVIYHVGGILKPFTAFASRRTNARDRLWTWFVTGMTGFIIFGTLLAALRKTLFGF